MTAMPSFGAVNPPVRDKNVKAIVAFLKKLLSSVSDKNFKAWAAPPKISGAGLRTRSGAWLRTRSGMIFSAKRLRV